VFFEVHPNPEHALCDRDNSLYLSAFEEEAPRLLELQRLVRRWDGAAERCNA
jgi:3-deoxy-D-manno-octulosonic acid (KDO) 8-phosphate synthase